MNYDGIELLSQINNCDDPSSFYPDSTLSSLFDCPEANKRREELKKYQQDILEAIKTGNPFDMGYALYTCAMHLPEISAKIKGRYTPCLLAHCLPVYWGRIMLPLITQDVSKVQDDQTNLSFRTYNETACWGIVFLINKLLCSSTDNHVNIRPNMPTFEDWWKCGGHILTQRPETGYFMDSKDPYTMTAVLYDENVFPAMLKSEFPDMEQSVFKDKIKTVPNMLWRMHLILKMMEPSSSCPQKVLSTNFTEYFIELHSIENIPEAFSPLSGPVFIIFYLQDKQKKIEWRKMVIKLHNALFERYGVAFIPVFLCDSQEILNDYDKQFSLIDKKIKPFYCVKTTTSERITEVLYREYQHYEQEYRELGEKYNLHGEELLAQFKDENISLKSIVLKVVRKILFPGWESEKKDGSPLAELFRILNSDVYMDDLKIYFDTDGLFKALSARLKVTGKTLPREEFDKLKIIGKKPHGETFYEPVSIERVHNVHNAALFLVLFQATWEYLKHDRKPERNQFRADLTSVRRRLDYEGRAKEIEKRRDGQIRKRKKTTQDIYVRLKKAVKEVFSPNGLHAKAMPQRKNKHPPEKLK